MGLLDKPEAQADMAAAEELFAAGKFSEAQDRFERVADNTANPPLLAEKARFHQAECLRERGYWPKSVDVYNKMLTDFPAGVYREQACARMFEIADRWLDDTRDEMELDREKREGKRWMVVTNPFHLDSRKPLFDEEGRALQALEQIHYNDITGPSADKALFMAGYVHFYRGNYRDADHFFTQLIEMHKDSPLRPQAIELAIMSKNNSTGGADYDGRKASEALKLVNYAESSDPQLVEKRGEFLTRQKMAIRFQQAEKDYKTAEFYQRTGHPGSAYFYYELVRRRYPGTKYSDLATVRMEQLKEQIEAEKAKPKSPGMFEEIKGKWDRLWNKDPIVPNRAAQPGEAPAGPEFSRPQVPPAGSQALPPPKPLPQEFLPR
jgi:outer membrane protein assembly factor BamD (BamD/ComL family)